TVSEVKARVLKPAQVESWRASSYDLLTGCTVRDVTDTIPGEIFDELFEPDPLRRFLTSASKRRGGTRASGPACLLPPLLLPLEPAVQCRHVRLWPDESR